VNPSRLSAALEAFNGPRPGARAAIHSATPIGHCGRLTGSCSPRLRAASRIQPSFRAPIPARNPGAGQAPHGSLLKQGLTKQWSTGDIYALGLLLLKPTWINTTPTTISDITVPPDSLNNNFGNVCPVVTKSAPGGLSAARRGRGGH